MTSTFYSLRIQDATAAAELHQLRRESAVDPELTEAQRQQVAEAVYRRFGQLNAAALPVQTPRWG